MRNMQEDYETMEEKKDKARFHVHSKLYSGEIFVGAYFV